MSGRSNSDIITILAGLGASVNIQSGMVLIHVVIIVSDLEVTSPKHIRRNIFHC